MAEKPPENDSSTFTDKMIEGAKAIPARVKKFANSIMGKNAVKPPPKSVAKPRKTIKKSPKPVAKARRKASKK